MAILLSSRMDVVIIATKLLVCHLNLLLFPNWFISLARTICYGGVTAPIVVSYGDSALV
jgi:hypothetical protein